MPREGLDTMMSPRSFLVSRQAQRHSDLQQVQQIPSSAASPSTSPSSSHSSHHTGSLRKDDRFARNAHTSPSSDISVATTMPARRREANAMSPAPSPPRTTTIVTRPATTSSPVQIPARPKNREPAHVPKPHRHHVDRRHGPSPQRPKDVHSPDAIPASVAALLAVTSIPPPRSARSVRQTRTAREKRMTVESIIERSQESEKEFSLTLSKGPLDLLLSAPEGLEGDDDISICDSTTGSVLSTRTISMESMPSLSESCTTDTFSSLESPRTPRRGRKVQPTRRSLEPVSSPPGELEDHPLSSPEVVVEDLDFRVFEDVVELPGKKAYRMPFRPLKSAFKSNLTASLRALRQAARSFSSLNFPSIPPEDFLTRSILTIDPQVPYTDERRPPPLEEEPTAALRRYLNPTTTVRLEQRPAASGPTTKAFTASIQMQTYKVYRARGTSSASGRHPSPSAGPSSTSQAAQNPNQRSINAEYPMPGPRQREMRENSDFIRIAVMEMAMRKRGKLDDQRPGRARWALPPRKASGKPYEVGPDGVPARWVAVPYE